MSTSQTLLYLYTETLLHVGTGSGLSSIDLPIQRERTTHYPTIAGSSIKGKLRATATMLNKHNQKNISELIIAELFGSERENAQTQQTENTGGQPITGRQEHAGALIVGDARLLLFPVRSLYGIFAYTTSYYALHRFIRDAQLSLQTSPDWQLSELPESLTTPHALVTDESYVTSGNTLILEEFNFEAEESTIVTTIAQWLAENALPQKGESNSYFVNKLKHSLVILSDNDFNDFISYSTEVVTRISIQSSTKTVTEGGLWTEENLPSDTLLYVPIYATDSRISSENQPDAQQKKTGAEILTKAGKILPSGEYIQLGGDETVGRGLVRTRWASNEQKSIKQEDEPTAEEEK
jgi:CRISPR-associated protein Cmr4